MPKKYRVIEDQILEGVDEDGIQHAWTFYDDVRIWNGSFRNCTWDHCKFHRTSFAHDTVFSDCRFVDCRFWAQHTYLGGPSRFERCEFSNCSFENVQFWQSSFVDCSLAGRIVNVVFYGPKAPKGWRSEFKRVDLSGSTLKDVDFRLGFKMDTVILPNEAHTSRIWRRRISRFVEFGVSHRRAIPQTLAKIMKRHFVVAFLTSMIFLTESHAERSLVDAYQPTSLLGTEGEGDPLGKGEWIAATIVSRPVIIGGAFPESPVHAISLPHKIAGAPEGFPAESNLIVIVGADVHAEWGQQEDMIIADFSKAKVPENLGVTLVQVMKMTVVCLQKTLGTQHEKPIKITWLGPDGISLADAGLPMEIKKTGEQAGADQPATRSESKSEGDAKPQPEAEGRSR